MQYTIEARQLTSEHQGASPWRTTVEASDPDEAISRFVADDESELVSFVRPRGHESIATIKKNDRMYLVRVYAN